MSDSQDFGELNRRKEPHRQNRAQQSIVEKMAIASRLREVQEKLAPVRAANKAKRRAARIKVQIKTA